MTVIRPLTREAAAHIATRLRARDVEEVVATSPFPDLIQWAMTMAGMPGEQVCVHALDEEPVMMGGVCLCWPGMANTWMVATDRIEEVGAQVHLAALRLHRDWAAKGVRRFQAYAIAKPGPGLKWMQKLGYAVEGHHPQFGRFGQSFYTMGKVA